MRKFGSAACKSWASRFRRRGFWRDEKGVTIVEFAAVAAPFFFTLFAVLEVATIFFGSSALETGVQEAARMIRTRELQLSGGGLEEFRAKLCEEATGLISCGSKLNIDVRTYPSFADADMDPPVDSEGNPLPGSFIPGGPLDVVVVRAYYVWDVHTPFLGVLLGNIGSTNSRLLLSTAAFRNEPS
ncbi:MAG: TadE/TadG family type IV pilus assembly protein [Pseudomonadota bacterium]|jgi:Flp pilus assembly protein TadG